MSDHPIRYQLIVPGFRFLVRDATGTEELNKPWRFEVAFALDPQTMTGDPMAFDPDVVIKSEATLIIERDGALQRTLQGIVSAAQLSATASGVPQVEMVLEPRFSLLCHRADVRIHRNLTAPQIVTEVAEALGVQIDNRLAGTYPNRPYCVQWNESDMDYCHRLLEDEGIFYFFTAGDVMVLGDNSDAYDAMPGERMLPCRAGAGINRDEDAVHEIGGWAELTSSKVTLRDWNTEHPNLNMDLSHDTSVPAGIEWYDYPGEYEEPGEGARKARLHAEAFDRHAEALEGATTCARMYPGATFALTGSFDPLAEGELVVRRLVHDFHRDEAGFEAQFEADPKRRVFRPARVTYVPRILNPHTGIVTVSSPGEDIHCDHFGRVKIHFHWDRLRPYDDDCSHWIPVLQDNTGGSSAIPREGWEMLVHYLEGDPDRPVVMGRTYTGDDRHTEKLPHAKFRDGLKSLSSPTRDGFNEIRLSDAVGQEHIFMHAQKDQNVNVANDLTIDIGNTENWIIKNDETIKIGNDAKWDIGEYLEPTVDNNQEWTVEKDRKLKIGGNDLLAVGGNRTAKIGGKHTRTIFADDNVSAKTMTEDITGDFTEKFKDGFSNKVGHNLELTVTGDLTEKIKEDKGQSTVKQRIEAITGKYTVDAGNEIKTRVDKQRTMTVGMDVSVECPQRLVLTGAENMKTMSQTASWTGSEDITLRVKDTTISFKNGLMSIKAPADITIEIDGEAQEGATFSTQI